MAASEQSEPQPPSAKAQGERHIPAENSEAMAAETQPDSPPAEATATNEAVATLEEQLGRLKAKENEIQQQLAQGGSESSEAADAEKNLADIRAASKEVQAVLSEVKTGKKSISAGALMSLSGRVGGILGDAAEEVAELGAATSDAQAHKAQRSAAIAASTTKKKPIAARVKDAVLGKSAAEKAAEEEAKKHARSNGRDEDDDEDEPEFKAQMDKRDKRNHDGKLSGREVAGGAVGVMRAMGSKKKRATYRRIVNKMSDAVENDDTRGMNDSAVQTGRGVARVTGSEDVGHAVSFTVSTGVTKANTAGNLVSEGDGWGLLKAASRNLGAMWEAGTDLVGLNSLADEVRKHLGSLGADKGVDWEKLVNAKGVKQFDTGGNGLIEAPEILQVLRNNGVTFAKLDDNRDGKINYAELRSELYAIAVKNGAHIEGGRGMAPAQKAMALGTYPSKGARAH